LVGLGGRHTGGEKPSRDGHAFATPKGEKISRPRGGEWTAEGQDNGGEKKNTPCDQGKNTPCVGRRG